MFNNKPIPKDTYSNSHITASNSSLIGSTLNDKTIFIGENIRTYNNLFDSANITARDSTITTNKFVNSIAHIDNSTFKLNHAKNLSRLSTFDHSNIAENVFTNSSLYMFNCNGSSNLF